MRKSAFLILFRGLTIWSWARQSNSPVRAGRSDPSFTQCSIAPGVDYTVPTEATIQADLDRILNAFARTGRSKAFVSAQPPPATPSYYNRPTSLEAPQGHGPTLMAGAEMITLLRDVDVEPKLNTFHYHRKK